MEKKKKTILAIIFFPITIIWVLIKLIAKGIYKKRLNKFIDNITVEEIDGLDGHAFEKVMYELLKNAKLKVHQTSKSRDFGADLIICTKYEKIVVQCKLYYNHNVGNSAVQEITTAKNYYEATLGVVITNSHFTKPAQALAESSKVILLDRENLKEFLALDRKRKKDYIETL